VAKDTLNLVYAEYNRQESFTFDTLELSQPTKVHLQHLPVEEYHVIQGLGLRTGGNMVFCGQVVQISCQCFFTEFARMPRVVKQDVLPCSVAVTLGNP